MGLLKSLIKLALVLLVGAIAVGVVIAVKRPTVTSPVSFDEWPSVPRNPEG